jgi:AcrR family transcriptional regulator
MASSRARSGEAVHHLASGDSVHQNGKRCKHRGCEVSKRYGGESVDERRQRRRQQLIDAAMDIVAGKGVASLKVRAVCSHARLNDRYFYESFPDCDALLLAAFEDQFGKGIAALLAAAEEAPAQPRPRIRAAVEAAFDFVGEDRRRPRLFIELQTSEALKARRRQFVAALAQVMVDQARELLGERVSEDRNVALACLTVVSGLLELTTLWFQDEIDVDRDQLVEFMIAMILTSAEITTALERELAEVEARDRV